MQHFFMLLSSVFVGLCLSLCVFASDVGELPPASEDTLIPEGESSPMDPVPLDPSDPSPLDPIDPPSDLPLDPVPEELDPIAPEPAPVVPEFTQDNPLPVVIVPESKDEVAIPFASGSAPSIKIGTTPPAHPLFYGSCWVTGRDSTLGDVTIYFPNSFKEGFLGIDSSGFLFNVSNTSFSGIADHSKVMDNDISFNRWNYPYYYGLDDRKHVLHLVPHDSNAVIATSLTPFVTFNKLVVLAAITLLGVLTINSIRRSH